MIYHFILNPSSGKRKKKKNIETVIKEACQKRNLNYHIYYTTCPGDATEYVRSMVNISSEKQRFICSGGDGTINELINSAPCNENVEFGVIPHGLGNDFVRNFTNTKNFYDIEAQLDGETIPVDLIKCNEFYSINMVNIGFDCSVVRESNKIRHWKFTNPTTAYVLGVIVVLFHKFGTKMKLVFDDGEVIDKNLTLTAIGNGTYCGGGFAGLPKAKLNDGLMDVCAINKVSRFKFLSLVGSYKKGKHLEKKNIGKYLTYKQVPHFKMEFDTPVPVCIDGEIKGAKNIDFSVVKDAVRFIVPKGSALKEKQ